jgi:hypothetical protein
MKTTIWKYKKVIIYIGGDPNKGLVPEFTIEISKPQIQLDTDTDTIVILETK